MRKADAANVLAVVRSGDKLGLFVNGSKVGEVPFRDFSGDNIGFALYAQATMEVDSLSVTEYPPEFAVELAKTELYADRPADFAKAAAPIYLDRGLYEEAAAAFLQAGAGVDNYRGMVAAYEALGQAEKAGAAKASLADLLFAGGKQDEALALYLQVAKPPILDAAGARYLGAGDLADAASLFKASGNAVKEKECYGRMADAQAKAGNIVQAAALYRKAGNESKAVDTEKLLTSLSASPQILAADQGSAAGAESGAFGLRIVDSSGTAVEVASPVIVHSVYGLSNTQMYQEGTQAEGAPSSDDTGPDVQLALDFIASASFNWPKKTVAVVDVGGGKKSIAMTDEWTVSYCLAGIVYQAGIPCIYEVQLSDVKSMARVEVSGAKPVDPTFASPSGMDGTIVDLKGTSYALTGVALYCQGSFDTGYAYNYGFGSAVMASCLREAEVITITLGKGSYEIPMGRVAGLSFKDKYYLSDSGLRCPLMGKISGLVAVAGDTPSGRVAMYPSSIAEVRLAKTGVVPKASEAAGALSGQRPFTTRGRSAVPQPVGREVRDILARHRLGWDRWNSRFPRGPRGLWRLFRKRGPGRDKKRPRAGKDAVPGRRSDPSRAALSGSPVPGDPRISGWTPREASRSL